ncbi:LytTR family transcriptional regulator [Frisingicoccus sp.]|uniref:LytTR family transcriptional regulator n=1 Tax=Frisingicoccus sp. TaxID=1918627 RepID=UPI002E797140|nr:LytTR family transcriptional regulator [Frisingicoccus sp.]MEE0751227.1 LytTR family transcriptional regulator [Frisingicoccus sp.]
MNRKVLQEAIELTQECLARYWQLDPEYVLSYCDAEVTWIGSAQSQFIVGKDAVAQDFRSSMGQLKPCHLVAQEFMVVQNTGSACTIAGRYLTTTDSSVAYFLQVQQRCTFVWEQTECGLKIRHMHVSNPMGELKADEGGLFVDHLGKMAGEYLTRHLHQLQDTKRLVVTDAKERVRFIQVSEVVYAEADGRSCIIYTMPGEKICAHMSITEFLAASDHFIPVHRSYVLNDLYVSCIQKYEISMLDGSKIPVPVKRYKEVRERLIRQHNEGNR